MDAMRCSECGDVRWSFTGLRRRGEMQCELCGGEMVPERRKPHRGPETLGKERRSLTHVSGPGPEHRPSAR